MKLVHIIDRFLKKFPNLIQKQHVVRLRNEPFNIIDFFEIESYIISSHELPKECKLTCLLVIIVFFCVQYGKEVIFTKNLNFLFTPRILISEILKAFNFRFFDYPFLQKICFKHS